MPKEKTVTFIPRKVANTTVRGERMRFNVYTNPDDKNPEVSRPTLARSIAVQLVKAGVGSIKGEKDEDVLRGLIVGDALEDDEGGRTGRNGGTVERNAARRLEEGAEGDRETERVTGADTRDTTAFVGRPLSDYGNTGEEGGAADDAPPGGPDGVDADAGGSGTGERTQAKKPAAKKAAPRKRTRAKPAAVPPAAAPAGSGEA